MGCRPLTSGSAYAIHEWMSLISKSPSTLSSLSGVAALAGDSTRQCRHSGRSRAVTTLHVLGGLLGITNACTVPCAPSTTSIAMSTRLVASWQRYVASVMAPLARSGGDWLKMAVPSSSSSASGTSLCTATPNTGTGASTVSTYLQLLRSSSTNECRMSSTLPCVTGALYCSESLRDRSSSSAPDSSATSACSRASWSSSLTGAPPAALAPRLPPSAGSGAPLNTDGELVNATTRPEYVCSRISLESAVQMKPVSSACTASFSALLMTFWGSRASSMVQTSRSPLLRPTTMSGTPSPVTSVRQCMAATPCACRSAPTVHPR
mmetsp:Transcript_1112/g.2603  ORF Transcript_1112/g.2603 Transcript_1112/m.2603 type:complete len:321 (-) Transcript_1112:721-1683(-)